jgi:hypothetical protein
MKIYQPNVLNTVDPYSGATPWGFPDFILKPGQTKVQTQSLKPIMGNYNGLSEAKRWSPIWGWDTPPSVKPPTTGRPTTGRPTIPGGQPTGQTARPMVLTPSAEQPEAPKLPTMPGTTTPQIVSNVTVQTTAKPWYKNPIYLTVLAAAAFLAAKRFKIIK